MVARLPIPGKDVGNWGEILNDFLSITHTSDGYLKPISVSTNHLQPGAVTEDKLSTSIQSAIQKANTAVQPTGTNSTMTSTNSGFYAPEDYGCATNTSASINDAAIASAIQDAITNNGVVQFTGRGPYNVAAAINQDVSKFVVRGNKTVLDLDDTFIGQYFWNLFSSASYQYADNLGVAISGVEIVGSGLGSTPLATVAIQIGHSSYINNSLFSVDSTYIQGFATAFKYIQNAWRIKIGNCRVTGGIAISAAAGLANFGENMVVDNCIFESYNPLISIGSGEWNFVNCSFNNTLITASGNCAIKLMGCHLEPHTVYPCINILHPQALIILENTTLIIDANAQITSAAFNVINTNITYGLIIRNLDTIQSANYNPQINNQNCTLVSGGGRVDMLGFSSNVNSYGFAISKSGNLLYNGDGEKGSTSGWTTYATYGGATTFTADNAMYKYGTYSLKLTTSASSIYIGQSVPCRPGQWVFAQCWNKLNIDSGTGNTFIDIDFLSAKGDVILTTGYTNVTVSTYWTCRRQLGGMSPVAPAGTVSVRVYIGLLSSASATAWYDEIIVNVA